MHARQWDDLTFDSTEQAPARNKDLGVWLHSRLTSSAAGSPRASADKGSFLWDVSLAEKHRTPPSTTLDIGAFDPESVSTSDEVTNVPSSNVIGASVQALAHGLRDQAEYERLNELHGQLAQKMFTDQGLSDDERRELAMMRWAIDSIDMEMMRPQLDTMRELVRMQENLRREVDRLVQALD